MTPSRTIKSFLLALSISIVNVALVHAADEKYTEGKATYQCIMKSDGKYQTEEMDGYTIYHTKVISTTAKDLVIYNDIGSAYNYRTIFIDHNAFNGNTTLETVTFEDTSSSSAKVHQYIDMSWGNSCFANCPNLKAIYMQYYVTTDGVDGKNHMVPIRPDWVRPEGSNTFTGSPNVKVYVDAEYYDDFCKDKYWSKYKELLVPTKIMRNQAAGKHGVKYDYDRNRDATYTPIITKGNLDDNAREIDVRLMHVTDADNSYIQANDGNAWIYNDVGDGYAARTTKVWAKAFYGNSDLRHVNVYDVENGKQFSHVNITLGDSAFANCENLHVFDLVYKHKDGTKFSNLNPNQIVLKKDGFEAKGVFANCPNLYIRVYPGYVDMFRNDSVNGWSEYADRIIGYFDEPTGGASYKGLKYSYVYKSDSTSSVKDCLTNKDNETMKEFLNIFSSQITSVNFRTDSLLVAPDVHKNQTVYYKFIGGSDEDLVDDENGVMTIVNDFGATYNYRTIAIAPTAFRGNENVKEIRFQDLPDGYACETYYPLRLAIPDGAFLNCKNLKTLNMFYYVTKGSNHYETLGPEDVYIGKNVFDGCSADFTIRVAPERLEDFLSDPDWARYKDYIRAWEYAPVDASSFTEDGVEYDYAATIVNNMPNDKVTRLKYSLWNYPIQVAKIAAMTAATVAGSTAFGAAVGAAWATLTGASTTGILASAFSHYAANWAISTAVNYGAYLMSTAYSEMGMDGLGRFMKYLMAAGKGACKKVYFSEAESVFHGLVIPAVVGAAKSNVLRPISEIMNFRARSALAKLATEQTLGNTKNVKATTFEDKQLDLIGNTVEYPTVSAWYSWLLNEQKTYNPYVIYKMYIKSLGKLPNGEMKIVNDIGQVYNYRTVAVGETAAKGNTNLKKITFSDINSIGAESYVPLKVVVPDHAFEGCTNLETLNMFIYMDYFADKEYALGPENFRLLGTHVFDNCPKLKIRIAREKLGEFMNDSIWSQYKNRFDIVDWQDPKIFAESGCYYGHNLVDNSLLDKEDNVWNMHVIGPSDNRETIEIAVDPGSVYDYHTTYVAKKAFYGDNSLKKIHFIDMTTNLPAANANNAVEIELKDSCFADCKNLQEVCMLYHTYQGTNAVAALSPDHISLGADVFAGCPDNFRILVATEQYANFLADPFWAQYAEHIVPFFFKKSDTSESLLADECKKYDGYSLYDNYRVLTKLKSTANWSDGEKEDVTNFDEYSLLAYLPSGSTVDNKSIPAKQFAGFKNLARVYIPYTAESVGGNAFEGTAVRRLIFGEKMKAIGAEAFKNCANLKFVELHCDKPSAVTINATAFDGVGSDYVITVPDTLVAEYKAQLPLYASHINGHSACPGKTELVTVDMKEGGDLLKYFGVSYEIKRVEIINTEMQGSATYKCNKCCLSEGNGNWRDIDSLKIVGPFNQLDYVLMLNMSNNMGGCLTYLDLSEAQMQYYQFKDADGDNIQIAYLPDFTNKEKTYASTRTSHVFSGVEDVKSLGLKSFICPLTFEQLRTLLWSKDYFGSDIDALSELQSVIFPEDFAGFSYKSKLPTNAVFLGNSLPSTAFLEEKSETTNIYAPYSAKTTFMYADNYGRKAKSVNSLFKDDEAFRVITKNSHDVTENDMATEATFGAWFKDNTKVTNLDDLINFSSITSLPSEAFSGCSSLERIAIPYDVNHIGRDAFKNCGKLTSITMIADSVPTLDGEDAESPALEMFADLPDDFKIYVTDDMLEKYLSHPQWSKYRKHIVSFLQTDELKTVTLTQPGTLAAALGLTTTVSDNKLASVSGPDITYIRRLKVNGPVTDIDIALLHFLTGCSPYSDVAVDDAQLRYLDLSDAWIVKPTGSKCKVADHGGTYVDNDNELPQYSFYNSNKLEKIILPRTLTKVRSYSLSKCNNLNTIILGENVSRVEGRAFEDSPRLVSIAITSKQLPNFSNDVFGSTNGILYNKRNFVENIHSTRSMRQTVANNSILQAHTLKVQANFDDDAMFRTVAMHCVLDTVSASLIDNIDGWFTGNTELKDGRQMRVFDGVTAIGDNMFKGCNALEKVVMPKKITSIGSDAFNGCGNLQYVDMTESRNLAVSEFSRESGTFAGVPQKTLVYMPEGNSQQFGDVNVVNTSDAAEQSDNAAVAASRCDDYQIEDRMTVDVPRPFRAGKTAYSRVFKTGVKSTVFLPYGMSAEQTAALGKFYAFESFNGSTQEVTFARVDATEPNTAYLFIPDGTGIGTTAVDVARSRESNANEVEFIGTYHNMKIESTPWAYGYVGTVQEGFEEGQFVKLKEGASVPSMRAYLQLKDVVAPQLAARFVDDGHVTGVGTITNGNLDADAPTDVYSLDGRKVRSAVMASECLKSLPSGIYVVKGKKYVVK